MIDYEKYKLKFGAKNKKNDDRHVSISKDVYDMLSKDKNFGIAFQNEINLAIMEDILIAISAAMMNQDKDGTLKQWKKLGEAVKKVMVAHKADENKLNDRYYQVSAAPEERKFFADNPIVKDNVNITRNVVAGLIELGMFYRAMSTAIGEAITDLLIKEKRGALDELYKGDKNGASSYYNILSFVISNWSRRIGTYESYSSNLKLINGGIKNVGRK